MKKRRRKLGFAAGVGTCLIIVGAILILAKVGHSFLSDMGDQTVDISSAENFSEGTLDIDSLGDMGTKVVNRQDGYEFQVSWPSVGNVSQSPIDLEIDRGSKIYKIYTEDFKTSQEVADYVAYSGKFLDNQSDHVVQPTQTLYFNNHKVTVNEWSREKMGAIEAMGAEVETIDENDMNHYVCADVEMEGNKVCTIFLKSSTEVSFAADVQEIASTMAVLDERGSAKASDNIRSYWAGKTKKVYKNLFGEDKGLTWGVYKWGIGADYNDLYDIESKVDYQFPVLLHYTHFDSEEETLEDVRARLKEADKMGRTTELTLQTMNDDTGNVVYRILNGEYDEYLNQLADILVTEKIPVLFRPFNEMNGDWCAYSAYHTSRDTDIFVELYKYIFELFRARGADAYTIWIWNPNERSFPNYKWNNEYNYYPGDEYVDVIGITGYNNGTYYEGETWRTFDEIYEPLYSKTVKNYDKPIMITEFACSNAGGDKEAWVKDMFRSIGKYDKIKVAVWWDGIDLDENGEVARSYRLEDEDVVKVFKRFLKQYK